VPSEHDLSNPSGGLSVSLSEGQVETLMILLRRACADDENACLKDLLTALESQSGIRTG